jgi:hypothetical protein
MLSPLPPGAGALVRGPPFRHRGLTRNRTTSPGPSTPLDGHDRERAAATTSGKATMTAPVTGLFGLSGPTVRGAAPGSPLRRSFAG